MKFIRVRSLQSKILLLFIFLLLVVQLISFFITFRANQQLESVQLKNTLSHAQDVFSTQFNNRRYYLSAFAETAAKDYGLKSVINEDTKSVLVALNNHRKRINADVALAVDSEGLTFAQLVTYQSEDAENKKVKVGAGQGKKFPYFEQYKNQESSELVRLNGLLYQLSLAPIKSGGRTIGWIGFGYVVDNKLSDEFAHLTEVNVGFVLKNDSTPEVIAHSALGSTLNFTAQFSEQLLSTNDPNYVSTSMPLGKIKDHQLIAIMFKSKADLLASIGTDWQLFFMLILFTLVLSIIGALAIAKSITKPIKGLIEQVKCITHGDYEGDVEVEGSKEITALANEFNHMTEAVISREKTISFQAYHDELTQLPNKNALLNALAKRNDSSGEFKVLQISILGADEINDTLGYKVGDEILVEVATRIKEISPTMEYYHLGGVNFVLIAEPSEDQKVVTQVLKKLMLDCHFSSINLHLQYAIGLVDSTQNAERDMVELLQKSSVALQQAIKNKLQFQKYRPEFDSDALERLSLTNSLKAAIEQNQLVLYYQPKLALNSMRITHVEALVRWEHPEKGLIPPDSFISIAETTGQMDALTRWVTKEAIKQYLLWQRKGLSIQIAINISAQNLLDKHYSDYVIDLKDKNGIPDFVITLEVTEDAVVEDPVKATELLTYLHDHGFKLSIDDYGTGYSSLAQLKQLPVQELKIDRSFVQQLASDESDQTIVKSSIELAHNLGLSVVAEGIEDESSLLWLQANGCELAQGFFISRPQPAEALETWLETSIYDAETVGA